MRCFRQPLAFLFLFIGFCGLAWSQPSFTSLRSTITDPSAAWTPGATVTTVNNATSITSSQAASDQVVNKYVSWGAYE
jgi:hypothetical protein